MVAALGGAQVDERLKFTNNGRTVLNYLVGVELVGVATA